MTKAIEIPNYETLDELRLFIRNELEASRVMCRITRTANCFPDRIVENITRAISSVESLLSSATEAELVFLYRSFRYEEIVTASMLLAYGNIDKKAAAYIPTPRSVLDDADASIKIIQIQLEEGQFPSGPGTSFIKELALAAEKLRMAVESGVEHDMKLEQSSTQAVIDRIIEVVATAVNSAKAKKL